MKKEWILQFNRKCAEFLKWIKTTSKGSRKFEVYDIPADFKPAGDPHYGTLILESLRFHSDWNWIMEVVKAINIFQPKSQDSILYINRLKLKSALREANKEAATQAIDECIDWYNKNYRDEKENSKN